MMTYFSPELFILLYGIVTLGVIAWLVAFLLKQNKNHFNKTAATGTKVRRMEDFSAQKKMDPDDPYDILGIPMNATRKEVLRAYKIKLKQYHPDVVSHRGEEWSEIAKQKTLKIQWAKEQVLLRRRNV